MPTHQIARGLETIYFRPVDRAWERIAMSLVAFAKQYDVSPQFEELDVGFPTLISGPRENLRNFLADPRLENAWWQLSDDFNKTFTSASARYWLMPVSLTFNNHWLPNSIAIKVREVIDQYGIEFTSNGDRPAGLAGSLWRFKLLLNHELCIHSPRFYLNDGPWTGAQTLVRLYCRYTPLADGPKLPTPSLSELFPRQWEIGECCLGDDYPCDFCE